MASRKKADIRKKSFKEFSKRVNQMEDKECVFRTGFNKGWNESRKFYTSNDDKKICHIFQLLQNRDKLGDAFFERIDRILDKIAKEERLENHSDIIEDFDKLEFAKQKENEVEE